MTFSVITVCFNAENEIKKTIDSVCSQTNTDYEYIFIDGKSSDHTLEVIYSYSDEFKKKGIKYKIISEPDTGIFNAMNKGILASNGEWVIFMNAGDYFFDEYVLEKVSSYTNLDVDILYGNVRYTAFDLYKDEKAEDLAVLKYRMAFCHQSSLVRRTYISERLFEERYKVSADYDFFLSSYRRKVPMQYIDILIAVYDRAGVSGDLISLLMEYTDVQYDNGVIDSFSCRLNKVKLGIKKTLRNIVILCGFRKCVEKRRYNRLVRSGYAKKED